MAQYLKSLKLKGSTGNIIEIGEWRGLPNGWKIPSKANTAKVVKANAAKTALTNKLA